MKKLIVSLAVLVAIVCAAGVAFATTFVAEGSVNATVSGSKATVVLDGKLASEAVKLIRYRDYKSPTTKLWMDEIPVQNGMVSFDLTEGNSFQLVNGQGHFVLLTHTMVFNQKYGLLKMGEAIGLVDPGEGYCFYIK